MQQEVELIRKDAVTDRPAVEEEKRSPQEGSGLGAGALLNRRWDTTRAASFDLLEGMAA